MKTVKTIAEYNRTDEVKQITLDLIHKRAEVSIRTSDGDYISVRVDLVPIWKEPTATQKNIIKGFIKAISADALSVIAENVDGDFLE